MAHRGKGRSRLEMRRQFEAAEGRTDEPAPDEADDDEAEAVVEPEDPEAAVVDEEEVVVVVAKKKAAKKPAKRKPTKKKVATQRMRMVWGVFDNGNNVIATFPFPERALADKRCGDLNEKGRGAFFVQPVKEPITEPKES